MKRLIEILFALLILTMFLATISMLFQSCKTTHRDSESVATTDTQLNTSANDFIQQHIRQQDSKHITYEWTLNYTLMSEPDSAGHQHPTQTGTLQGKAKDESTLNKEIDHHEKKDTSTNYTARKEEKHNELVEESGNCVSITPISLAPLALGLIIVAIAVKWLVRKRSKQVP